MTKNEQGGTQEPLSSEINTTTAAEEVSGVVGRIMHHHAEMRKEAPQQVVITPEQVFGKLSDGGYPKRSIERIREGLWGPGLEKAESVLKTVLMKKKDAIIIVHGDRGPGKTQMATWWAFKRGMEGKAVGRYVKALDLLREIKATWNNSSKTTEQRIVSPYVKTKFLVIDEVQERPMEGNLAEWASQTITNIVDKRYDELFQTVLIGNFDKEALPEIISPSITSRATECGGNVFCDWPSYRK